MRRDALVAIAAAEGVRLDEQQLDELVHQRGLREPLSLCAYIRDVMARMRGEVVGSASLALWRGFAWTPQGSPKQGFALDADEVIAAEETLRRAVASA